MKGKWKVSHNYAGGEKLIQVYRQLDVNDVDHAGNREYKPGFFETDEEAQALADSLQRKRVVTGASGPVCVDRGGRRRIEKTSGSRRT